MLGQGFGHCIQAAFHLEGLHPKGLYVDFKLRQLLHMAVVPLGREGQPVKNRHLLPRQKA